MAAVSPYSLYAYPLVLLRVGNDPAATDLIDHLVDFKYEDHLNKADVTSWQFVDPTGSLVDDPRFEPDTEWHFRFGYAGDISGVVRQKVKYYEPVYAEDGTITITITTMGKSTDMMRTKAPHNWGSVPSSDIAKAMASRYGFQAKVEASPDALPDSRFIQPQDMSDFEYLHALAAGIDYEFFVENNTLYYRSRDTAYSEPARMSVQWWADYYPSILRSLKPSIRATKPGKVKASSHNPAKGKGQHRFSTNKTVPGKHLGASKPVQDDSTDPDGKPQGTDPSEGKTTINQSTGEDAVTIDLETGSISSLSSDERADAAAGVLSSADTNAEQVQRQAHALKRHYLDALVNSTAEWVGTPRVRAKVTFEITGIHRRLSGLWYCTEAIHHITSHKYETQSSMKRGAYNAAGKHKSKGGTNTNTQSSVSDLFNGGSKSNVVVINNETGETSSPSAVEFSESEVDTIDVAVPSK